MQSTFDSKLYVFEQKVLEHVKLQCHGWQTAFDSRLNALEEYTRKDTNAVVKIEERLSAIEDCMVPLLDLCALKHQQSLDLSNEVTKIQTIVSDLEESFGRNLQEAVHQHSVEQKRQSNKSTTIHEDGNPVTPERVRGIVVAHKQECLRQQRLDQRQELESQLTSILQNIETRLATIRSAGSKCRSFNQKSTDEEVLESSGIAHQPDAVPLVCNHESAFSKDTALVNEHVGHLALGEISDCQQQEDAIARIEQQLRGKQLLLAKATRCFEQVVPFNKCNLSQKCSTVMSESDTAVQMPTN